VDELFGMDWNENCTYEYGKTSFSISEKEVKSFRDELIMLKREINKAFKELRSKRRSIRKISDKNVLVEIIKRANIEEIDLETIFEKTGDNARKAKAMSLLDKGKGASKKFKIIEDFIMKLMEMVGDASKSSSVICKEALKTSDDFIPKTAKEHARACLWHYYRYYEDYDMVLLPMLYSAQIGEADTVEIIRISPEDATSLIDEGRGDGRKKLAGVALGHFGAFLEKAWRVNDILWGRLDGAERIISAMLHEREYSDYRKKLISDAHKAIIREDLVEQDRTELCKLLVDAIIRSGTDAKSEKDLFDLIKAETGSKVNPKLEAILRACLNEKQLIDFFKSKYEVDRTPNPKSLLKSFSRATRVIGKVIEEIGDRHGQKGSVSWVARLGQVFWGLVIVAVPGSMLNLFFRHWLKVLYTFEIILIAASLILSNQPMINLGFILFGVTAAVHVLVKAMNDFMRGRRKFLYIIVFITVFVFIVFTFIGVDRVFKFGYFEKIFDWIK
jgi:hypothetical protein